MTEEDQNHCEKKGKNGRLKNTWKAGKSDETDQISTKIGNQIMK